MEHEQERTATEEALDMMGLLFSCDPKLDAESSELFDLVANLDEVSVADSWPAVDAEDARPLLVVLRQGASGDLDQLALQYRKLFIGPAVLDAPPYGSVYTDRDQVVFGESTLALRYWMREVGVAADDLGGAPEDHIGTMILLLSWLIAHKPDVVDEYLAEHLLTWAPHYLEQLETAAGDGFYGALARLASRTLVGMGEERELHVIIPRFYR